MVAKFVCGVRLVRFFFPCLGRLWWLCILAIKILKISIWEAPAVATYVIADEFHTIQCRLDK